MKENKGPLIYAIVGICTLIIAIVGATYAYYAASATAEISGTAGGGNAPTLTVVEASNVDNSTLIPVDMVKETLDKAAKGWNKSTNAVGTSWNADRACKDKNGNSVCKIYSVTLTNNSSSSVKYKIELTSLTGTETPNNTPNIKAVAMGTSKTEVTSIDPIVGVEAGIAANVQLAGNASSSTFYFMVFIENLNTPQSDSGSFTGTITAIGGDGGRIEADFGKISFYVLGNQLFADQGATWRQLIDSGVYGTNLTSEGDLVTYNSEYVAYEDGIAVYIDDTIRPNFNYGMCLTGDTIINTKNGYMEIKDLKVNDLVLSYNEKTGVNEYKAVSKIGKFESKTISVKFNNSEIINMTLSHPLYSYDGNIVRAKDLKIGDKIKTIDGYTTITSIDKNLTDNTVYMITVEDNHNFYITYNNLLSHNKPT